MNIYNELGEELGVLSLSRNDSIEKILEYIDSNDLHHMRSYFLAESQQDDDALPRDFEVKNLESNKIYVNLYSFRSSPRSILTSRSSK